MQLEKNLSFLYEWPFKNREKQSQQFPWRHANLSLWRIYFLFERIVSSLLCSWNKFSLENQRTRRVVSISCVKKRKRLLNNCNRETTLDWNVVQHTNAWVNFKCWTFEHGVTLIDCDAFKTEKWCWSSHNHLITYLI